MPYSNGYSGQRVITIPAGRVPGPLTNFPFFWHGTETDFRSVANGGLVQNSSGFDIIFTSDSGGTVVLNFEIVVWNPTSGFISAWINLPTVHHATDNVIYAWFGNASITTQQSPGRPWDSNYKLVSHFQSTPPNGVNPDGTVNLKDSTANGNNFASNASGSGAMVGINGQLQGDGVWLRTPGRLDESWLSAPNAASIQDLPLGPMTIEFLAQDVAIQKAASDGSAGWGVFQQFVSGVGNCMFLEFIYTTTPADFRIADPFNGTTHIVITWDGVSICKMYANGAPQTVTKISPVGTQPSDSAQSLELSGPNTSWYGKMNGPLDEFRISNVARSADYAAASALNQLNPQYFSQTSAPPAIPRVKIFPFAATPYQVDPLYQPQFTRGCGFATLFANNPQVPSNSRNAQFSIGGKLYMVAIGFPSTFPGSTVPDGSNPNAYGALLVEKSLDGGRTWEPQDIGGLNPYVDGHADFQYSACALGTAIYVAYLGQNSGGSVVDLYVGKFDTVTDTWVSFTPGAGISLLDLDIGSPRNIGLNVIADGDYIVVYGYTTSTNMAASHFSGGAWAAPLAPVGATVSPVLMGFGVDQAQSMYVFYSEARSNQHDWGGNNGVFYFVLDKTCTWGSQQIAVINMKNGEPMDLIGTYPTNIDSMVVLPCGKRLASLMASKSGAEFDGDIKLYPAIIDIDTAGFALLSTSLEDSPDTGGGTIYFTQMVMIGGICHIFWAVSNLQGTDYPGQPVARIRYCTTTDGITFTGPFTAYDAQLTPPPNYVDMGFELANFVGNGSQLFGITQLNVTTDSGGSIYVSFTYGAGFTPAGQGLGRGFFTIQGWSGPGTEAFSKFAPDRTLSLRSERGGCAAALSSASSAGCTVSGVFSDLADFVELMLFDADDNFGHLTTTRYLPDFALTGVVVEFDLTVTGGMNPGSSKSQAVPWGKLSWVKSDGTSGATALDITSATGQVAAAATFTVNGTPAAGDRVQLIYLGNVVFDYTVSSGDTVNTVAAALVAQINAATSSAVPLTAAQSGPSFTVTCTQPGTDGNTIELLEMHKTSTCYLTPAGTTKLTGGIDPSSMHVKLDFSAMGLASLRQCWMTLAPPLPIDSGATNPTLVAFAAGEFEYVFSNWTVTDPDVHTPLKIAGTGSITVGSRDEWVHYAGSGWAEREGSYYRGFARQSANSGDSVTVKYWCQFTHDLFVGTALGPSYGKWNVTVDGVSQPDVDCSLGSTPGRRLLEASVAAGEHTVVLTLANAAPCLFDFLQAAVRSDVVDPAVLYPQVNAACDYDTPQTHAIAPARALWVLQQLGFRGDLDFYAGVRHALRRTRVGGRFHQATVTIAGYGSGAGIGTGIGDGDSISVDVGGTTITAAVYPADTLATLAQRLVDGINGLLVGVAAAPTGTAGQFTITTLSPINGYTLTASLNPGAAGTVGVTGDVAAGNEGIWGIDASVVSPPVGPLNRAFRDYLADFAHLVSEAWLTMTVGFSQELLAPPDANTSAGAWAQRFADGSIVLKDAGPGTWGAGFVEAVSGSAVQQTGHGYVTGYAVQIVGGSGSGEWRITVTDADHYDLTTRLDAGSYSPGVGDSAAVLVRAMQGAFNSSTVTAYLERCYLQVAGILNAAGIALWLQLREIMHWPFSESMSVAIAGFADSTGLIEVQTAVAHGFTTGQTAILAGTGMADGTRTVTVVDATHFTVDGSAWPGGSPAAQGTVSGGGMALYDANQAAAATTALGRALAPFDTQDDDPTINAGADAVFLSGRIWAHGNAIVTAVQSSYPCANFELLYPLDRNHPTCYYTDDLPNPQGGRLNGAMNLPSEFTAKAGSGLNRLKMEGLSWESFYFDQNRLAETARYPYTELSWSKSDAALLIGWSTGACPWTAAYLFFLNEGIPLLNLSAADHAQRLSWGVPLPVNEPRVRIGG